MNNIAIGNFLNLNERANRLFQYFIGEFDPGSGRTLAACLTHASRTGRLKACFYEPSGKRVSNAWATYRKDGDNIPKGVLIPNVVYKAHALYIKGFNPLSDGPASD